MQRTGAQGCALVMPAHWRVSRCAVPRRHSCWDRPANPRCNMLQYHLTRGTFSISVEGECIKVMKWVDGDWLWTKTIGSYDDWQIKPIVQEMYEVDPDLEDWLGRFDNLGWYEECLL